MPARKKPVEKENQDVEYGSVPFAPTCEKCTQRTGELVSMKVYRTVMDGEIHWYRCPYYEQCKTEVPQTRPKRKKRIMGPPQNQAAVRPDQKSIGMARKDKTDGSAES